MQPKIPFGISDFNMIRENGYYTIDKSLLIEEVLQANASVILLPRPRRFGKSFNLSMLRYFFEQSDPDRKSLFEGLKIADRPECMEHQGKYPVIFFTFKDEKEETFDEAINSLSQLISEEYKRHSVILESDQISDADRMRFEKICNQEATLLELKTSLQFLCKLIAIATGQNPIILIDEYDTPIHTGYEYRYYKEIVGFFRRFLGAGLKDNPYLEKAVLTGILRIAKESIFSDLNNLDVCSLMDPSFSNFFGLLESEVALLLSDFGINTEENRDQIQKWYNGYNFAGRIVYNPWSVLGYLNKYPLPPRPYWVNTSSNEIVKKLLQNNILSYYLDLECLIRGESISCYIVENTIFSELETTKTNLWSFLLFTGYLTAKCVQFGADGTYAELTIPNIEVRQLFLDTVRYWFEAKEKGHSVHLMLEELSKGEVDHFVVRLQRLVMSTLSTFDTAINSVEIASHMFVLGLLVNLEGQYRVRSNREAGTGRYDIALEPVNHQEAAFIFEFKALKVKGEKAIQTATANALEQIHQRQYYTDLVDRGIQKICCIALVFEGKTIHHQFEWVDGCKRVPVG